MRNKNKREIKNYICPKCKKINKIAMATEKEIEDPKIFLSDTIRCQFCDNYI